MSSAETVSLQSIGEKHGTDKAVNHHFMDFYEKWFAPMKNDKFNFLEIGYLLGQSARTWLEYFPNAQIYYIEKKLKKAIYHPRMHFARIDQTDEGLSNLFPDDFFTVILDDGSHMTSAQQKAFSLLWPKLKTGGVYIIEDINTSFRPRYIDSEVTTYNAIKAMGGWKIFEQNPDSMTALKVKE